MVSDIFEITFEKAAIGMAHVGADGKWIRVNQQLCHFLGYSREELLKLTFQDITHQDDLDFDLTHTEQLYQGLIDSFSIEKRYIRKDGKLTWAQLSASCVRDSAGQIDYFISVIADINERKKLEIKNNKTRLKLELSNQKYKKLNQNLKKAEHLAKLGNWSFDIVNNKLSWSDEIFNIFEMDSERFEATYEAFLNAIHPEDRAMIAAACNNGRFEFLRISYPILLCVFITSYSSESNLPGLSKIASEIPILPISCIGEAL